MQGEKVASDLSFKPINTIKQETSGDTKSCMNTQKLKYSFKNTLINENNYLHPSNSQILFILSKFLNHVHDSCLVEGDEGKRETTSS
uniref:Uncharacterized protein n=1 Tax=Manihot esculenta TaxID=3983 RepID=A0A2C9VRQ5_MANES